jgi:hypothetical protein
MRFPTLHARDLEQKSYSVPDELPGRLRVILLPFKQWQQILVGQWEDALAPAFEGRDDVTVWEVPALGAVWKPVRGYIDGGMRGGIPDVVVRRHTLTSYGELDAIRAGLGISDRDTAYAFLLDALGEVVWCDSGEPDPAKVAAFAAALAEADAGPAADAEAQR